MSVTLYFLRSTEQKIAEDMLHFAYRLDEVAKTVDDICELEKYTQNYGLTNRDLGLYALKENKIAGAIWLRLLKEDDNANGYVNDNTPVLTIGVKPEFRGEGVGSSMLEQLILEAGSLYENISVSVLNNNKTVSYFEKFGFSKIEESLGKSPTDGTEVMTMIKAISKELVKRPSDGYDPRKWMD
ncbi:GNAT family N-acetyltransferase [Candidatus Sulfurimonas baltica]|nr:GNAT family N-acetyltransferase [Candidatus Sulfurimonas baltica]